MNKQTILVADDDPAIVDAIQLILEDEGYNVITTVDGATIYKMEQVFPDLLLLDIWMSGQDGREICRYLKRETLTAHIPIIMISANNDAATISLEAGADGFLAKPFDIQDLLAIVKRFTSDKVE